MSKKRMHLSVSVSEDVIAALDAKTKATGVSRSAWAEQALRAALLGGDLDGNKVRGETGIKGALPQTAEVAAKISNILDKKLMEVVAQKPELLASLDDKTLAQLLVARAPKPHDGDIELELSYLSLTESLSRLPEVEDLTKELGKQKLRVETLLCEMDTHRQITERLGKRLWREDGFDWYEFKKVMNAWQTRVIEVARRGGDVIGVELPDFHCCLTNARRFDASGLRDEIAPEVSGVSTLRAQMKEENAQARVVATVDDNDPSTWTAPKTRALQPRVVST
jgi:hypothetical protein